MFSIFWVFFPFWVEFLFLVSGFCRGLGDVWLIEQTDNFFFADGGCSKDLMN